MECPLLVQAGAGSGSRGSGLLLPSLTGRRASVATVPPAFTFT
jgi:hypothetical protein